MLVLVVMVLLFLKLVKIGKVCFKIVVILKKSGFMFCKLNK